MNSVFRLHFTVFLLIISIRGKLVNLAKERRLPMQVNVFEAKTDFSKLIRLIETKREESITVARNGKPVVRIVPVENIPVSKRIGVAKGKFIVPD